MSLRRSNDLSTRANDLAALARSADFAELADQAHALHKRLAAFSKKLQRTGEN